MIPGPFRNPLEFCGTEIPILAGSTAKISIPWNSRNRPESTRIDQIPADSGRNTWRTVKNSTVESQIPKFVLAPALIGFARFRKQLANGTIKVRLLDMPIFLWENNNYDPDNLTAGMFGMLLL